MYLLAISHLRRRLRNYLNFRGNTDCYIYSKKSTSVGCAFKQNILEHFVVRLTLANVSRLHMAIWNLHTFVIIVRNILFIYFYYIEGHATPRYISERPLNYFGNTYGFAKTFISLNHQ